MGLRFPLEYSKNMPFVNFRSMKFTWPAMNLKANEMQYTPTNSSISLYLPGDYSEQIQARWGMQEVMGGATTGFFAGLEQEMQNAARDAAGGKIANTYSGKTVTTAFPSDIMIFDAVEPITLNFDFNMVPISKHEAAQILAITREFKRKSLPVLESKTAGRLIYPDVWDIRFRGVQGMGLETDKVYRGMALTNVSVSYPSGATSLLVYADGRPVQTKLTLQFQATRKHRLLTGDEA